MKMVMIISTLLDGNILIDLLSLSTIQPTHAPTIFVFENINNRLFAIFGPFMSINKQQQESSSDGGSR
jgi:hypothetical protein